MTAITVRRFGIVDYETTVTAMQEFTATRDRCTPDEVWLLQHPPVLTLGLAGKMEHILAPSDVRVARTDRGGQVTYHGPGQIIAYVLIDLVRRNWTVRHLVWLLEDSVLRLLDARGVVAERRSGAPGIYVNGRKIAALGLRIRRGCSYHGLALNVDMDLTPFRSINPCGYPGLRITQTRDEGVAGDVNELGAALLEELLTVFGSSAAMSRTVAGANFDKRIAQTDPATAWPR